MIRNGWFQRSGSLYLFNLDINIYGSKSDSDSNMDADPDRYQSDY